MTNTDDMNARVDLAALEAVSRARLLRQGLERLAGYAGYRACQAVGEDAGEDQETGTHRCPSCGYRWEPEPMDFYGVGPLSRRSLGDGPRDQAIDCPACGRQIGEFDLEEVT